MAWLWAESIPPCEAYSWLSHIQTRLPGSGACGGTGPRFSHHCYFLYPTVQCSLGEDASQPLEDIKASSMLTAHVMSQLVNICTGKGRLPRSPRATSCALDQEGPHLCTFAHATLPGCCCQNLPSSTPVVQSESSALARTWSSRGHSPTVTRTKQSPGGQTAVPQHRAAGPPLRVRSLWFWPSHPFGNLFLPLFSEHLSLLHLGK